MPKICFTTQIIKKKSKTCSSAALSETGATEVGVPSPKFFIRNLVVKFTKPLKNIL